MAIPNQTAAPTTGTTAGGTAYTQWAVTIPASADPAFVLAPTALAEGARVNAVISCHGSGGTRATINGTNTATVRDALLDAGYLILSPQMHGDSWSNEPSMTDLTAIAAWARGVWSVPNVLLFAQSMGGGTGALAVARKLITGLRGAALLAPAVSLSAAYAKGDPTAADIRTAYGIASDGSDYSTRTAGHDALERDATDYAGSWLRFYASASDSTTSKAANTDALRSKIAGQPAEMDLVTVTGGHLSADHYRPSDVVSFYGRALAAAAVADQTRAYVDGAFVAVPTMAWTGTAWVQTTDQIF